MRRINYLLDGFGFSGMGDFKASTFGHILEMKLPLLNAAALWAFVLTAVEQLFGVNALFFTAYAILIIFEWVTGVAASLERGEKHESRKLARMILKILVYSLPIYILNTFRNEMDAPVVLGYEANPFDWIYWVVMLVIIWQLLVSMLENLDSLGYRWARMLIRIINRNFYQKLKLDGEADTDRAEKTDAV